jgi:drug/metabolite transporter (DMT)-like permease
MTETVDPKTTTAQSSLPFMSKPLSPSVPPTDTRQANHAYYEEGQAPGCCRGMMTKREYDYALGILFVILVALIWAVSSALVQFLYETESFNSPFLLTYIGVSLFTWPLPVKFVTDRVIQPCFQKTMQTCRDIAEVTDLEQCQYALSQGSSEFRRRTRNRPTMISIKVTNEIDHTAEHAEHIHGSPTSPAEETISTPSTFGSTIVSAPQAPSPSPVPATSTAAEPALENIAEQPAQLQTQQQPLHVSDTTVAPSPLPSSPSSTPLSIPLASAEPPSPLSPPPLPASMSPSSSAFSAPAVDKPPLSRVSTPPSVVNKPTRPQPTPQYDYMRNSSATLVDKDSDSIDSMIDAKGSKDSSDQWSRITNSRWTRKQHIQAAAQIAPVWFLANWTFNASLSLTSIASSTVLLSSCSLFAFAFAVITNDEIFHPVKLAGVLIGICGTGLITLHDYHRDECYIGCKNVLLGDLLALTSAIAFGFYAVQIRVLCPRNEQLYSMQRLLGYIGLINTILLSPVAIIEILGNVKMTIVVFELILVRSIFDYVLSEYLYFRSVILTSATVATLGLALTIPFAFVVDLIMRKPDVLSKWSLAGAFAVISGFLLVNIGGNNNNNDSYDRALLETLVEEDARRWQRYYCHQSLCGCMIDKWFWIDTSDSLSLEDGLVTGVPSKYRDPSKSPQPFSYTGPASSFAYA